MSNAAGKKFSFPSHWKAGFCFCIQWMNSCSDTCWQIEACCIAKIHTVLPSPWCLHRSLPHRSVCQGLSRSSSPHSATSNILLPQASQSSQDTDRASVLTKVHSQPPLWIPLKMPTPYLKWKTSYFKHAVNCHKTYNSFPFPSPLHTPIIDMINIGFLLLVTVIHACGEQKQIYSYSLAIYLYNSKHWGPWLSGGREILLCSSLTKKLELVR